MKRLKSAIRSLESKLGDTILGVSTLGNRRGSYPEANSAHDDSFWYESKSYYLNWLYLRPLALKADDVVYDVGCGAGRLLFVAALHGVTRCVGVELSKHLAELALNNASKLRFSHSLIGIRQGDASKEDYSDGTVFLFCNPFGASTLHTVLERIRESLQVNPRKIRLMYIHPEPDHLALFSKCDWLQKTDEKTFPGAWDIPALYFISNF